MKIAIFSFIFMILFVISTKNVSPVVQTADIIILAALGLFLGYKIIYLILLIKERNK